MGFTNEKPDCPKCRTNVNVVKYPNYYRCCYCGTRIPKDSNMRGEIQEVLF